MNCIETKNLVHRFSEHQTVLKGISLEVPEGSIYGFLGQNGAGKTTTLKLLLGLLKKQQGEILIFGKPFERNRIEILQKTGSLIESPSIYGHLTAVENLKLLQKIYRCENERVQYVLELTGLSEAGDKKAGKFSLGMKQRLSIAIALLNNPSLLILDEPTNGLDPNGIIEMRAFLKKLNIEQNITIIISSHLLTEVEKLASHVGIIHQGDLIFQGTLEALMSIQVQSSVNVFETSDNEAASKIVLDMKLDAYIENGKVIIPCVSKQTIANLNSSLAKANIQVFEIATIRKDLEEIFLDLIKTYS
jgi:ABC-type multidrug transport system ATPase subunit